jgi:hypothetical protein
MRRPPAIAFAALGLALVAATPIHAQEPSSGDVAGQIEALRRQVESQSRADIYRFLARHLKK